MTALSLFPNAVNSTHAFLCNDHNDLHIIALLPITGNVGFFWSFNQNMQLWGGSIKIVKVGSLLTGGGIGITELTFSAWDKILIFRSGTNYFATDLAGPWRRIVAPSICFGLSGVLLFWFLLP